MAHEIDPIETSHQTLASFREEIRSLGQLSKGWDSYSSDPPSGIVVSAALTLLDELEKSDVLPEWVVPTGDSNILMAAKKDGTLLKWEIDSDGDIAVMLQPKFSPATYHDLAPDEIGPFLKRNFPEA